MASAGRKLREITPTVTIRARPEVVHDNSIVINCGSIIGRLKEKMQALMAENTENIQEESSHTDKQMDLQDQVCVVVKEVAATSDCSDNHNIAIGYEDGCRLVYECFIYAGGTSPTSFTARRGILQTTLQCLSKLSRVAANRAILSHLGICKAVSMVLNSSVRDGMEEDVSIGCLQVISNMANRSDDRCQFSLLNVASALTSTVEKAISELCTQSSYEMASCGFRAIGNLCSYNAENRRLLGNPSTIRSIIVGLEKCTDTLRNSPDDMVLYSSMRMSVECLFAMDQLVYNNTNAQNLLDNHNVCSVIVTFVSSVHAYIPNIHDTDDARSYLGDILKQSCVTVHTLGSKIRSYRVILQDLGTLNVLRSCLSLSYRCLGKDFYQAIEVDLAEALRAISP